MLPTAPAQPGGNPFADFDAFLESKLAPTPEPSALPASAPSGAPTENPFSDFDSFLQAKDAELEAKKRAKLEQIQQATAYGNEQAAALGLDQPDQSFVAHPLDWIGRNLEAGVQDVNAMTANISRQAMQYPLDIYNQGGGSALPPALGEALQQAAESGIASQTQKIDQARAEAERLGSDSLGGQIVRTIPQMGAAIGSTLVAGPAGPAALFGAQQQAASYEEARGRGVDPLEAQTAANLAGLASGMLNSAGAEALTGRLQQVLGPMIAGKAPKLAKAITKTWLGSIGAAAGFEMPQEALDETTGWAAEVATGKFATPQDAVANWMERAPKAAAVGGGAALFGGAIGHAVTGRPGKAAPEAPPVPPVQETPPPAVEEQQRVARENAIIESAAAIVAARQARGGGIDRGVVTNARRDALRRAAGERVERELAKGDLQAERGTALQQAADARLLAGFDPMRPQIQMATEAAPRTPEPIRAPEVAPLAPQPEIVPVEAAPAPTPPPAQPAPLPKEAPRGEEAQAEPVRQPGPDVAPAAAPAAPVAQAEVGRPAPAVLTEAPRVEEPAAPGPAPLPSREEPAPAAVPTAEPATRGMAASQTAPQGEGFLGGAAAPTRVTENVTSIPGPIGETIEDLGGDTGAAKAWVKRYFTSKRGLTARARAALEERAGRLAETEVVANDLATSLDHAIQRHAVALAEQEKATGTTPNLAHIVDRVKATTTSVLRGELSAEESKLPPEITDRALAFRQAIDTGSKEIAAEPEMIPDALKEVFGKNAGSYLTRPYQVHKIGGKRRMRELKRGGRAQWNAIRDEIAAMEEFQGWDTDRIEGWMEAELGRFEPGSSSVAPKGGEPGTQTMGIYKKRKAIPEPIRKLYGEITDPAVLGFITLTNIRRNLDTYRMYSALREAGLEEGWLSETEKPGFLDVGGTEATAPLKSRRHREKPKAAEGAEEAGAEGEANKGVVRGTLFGRRDMLDTLQRAEKNVHIPIISWTTGAIKLSKTVFYATGQIRNMIANPLLMLASGNIGPAPWHPKSFVSSTDESLADYRGGNLTDRWYNTIRQQGENMTIEKIAGAFGRGTRLGVLNSNPDLADIRAMMGARVVPDISFSGDAKTFWKQILWAPPGELSAVRRGLKWVDKKARWAYRKGDEMFKYHAWRDETLKQKYMHPNLTEEQAEVLAADVVKDVFPTDTRAPEALRMLRKWPVMSTFISFVSEIPRNLKNVTKLGAKEVLEGRRTGNKRMIEVGVHRLASTLAATSAVSLMAYGIKKGIQQAFGWDDDKADDYESAARVFLPYYSKNSTLAVFPLGKGKAVAFDISFMDPYAVIRDPILTFFRTGILDEKEIDQRFKTAAEEFLDPYTSPGLGLDLVTTLMRGVDKNGKQIFDPAWPPDKIREARFNYAVRGVEPGTFTQARRLALGVKSATDKAAGGEGVVDPVTLREYNWKTELFAFLGMRPLPLDAGVQLGFSARAFSDLRNRAAGDYRREVKAAGGNARKESAEETYRYMYDQAIKNIATSVAAARVFGLSDDEIRKILKDEKIKEEIRDLAMSPKNAVLPSLEDYREQDLKRVEERVEAEKAADVDEDED